MKRKNITPAIIGVALALNNVNVTTYAETRSPILSKKSKKENYTLIKGHGENNTLFKEEDKNNNSWVDEYVASKVGKNISDLTNSDYESIVELDMSNHSLNYLPKQLAKLTNLKAIDLSENNLENIDLSFLSNLEVCYLQGNKLKEVPESLANMKTLKKVDLSDNQIYKSDFLNTLILNNDKLKDFNLVEPSPTYNLMMLLSSH